MSEDREWTEADLDELGRLVDARVAEEDIAARMGRPVETIRSRRIVIQQRKHRPEPTFGPDEEGDVLPTQRGDSAGWVHTRTL